MSSPWSLVASVSAAFSSTPTALSQNKTREVLWSIVRPFEEGTGASAAAIFVGMENGLFINYKRGQTNPKRPIYLLLSAVSSSCPNVPASCMRNYDNCTDPFTGRIIGSRSGNGVLYDPRTRPVMVLDQLFFRARTILISSFVVASPYSGTRTR
jgi:hypothetical protein